MIKVMNTKKPKQNKEENPLENVKVNISMTRGTSEVLKKLADHLHISASAAVTGLIRTEAERVGILSPIAGNLPAKEVEKKLLRSLKRDRVSKAG